VAPSGPTQQTIWDAGGYNVIDLSQAGGSTSGYRIDTRPLGWVTTGANFLTSYMMAGTAIGPGVRIQEVVTSPNNDTVYLNQESNIVRGYGPGTVAGSDVIVGGTEADTLDLSGYSESAVSQLAAGADLIVGLGAAGEITLRDYYAGARVRVTFSAATTPNQPPVAAATATPPSGVAPLTVTFSAAGSSDVDGRLVSYAWTLPGVTASGATAQYTFTAAGTYQVTLTVTDDDGALASATTMVTVTTPPTPTPTPTGKNRAPTAVVAAEPASGAAPLTVLFDGTGSFDADGAIVGYEWSFGNGATATGTTAAYTYTTPGTYLAVLAVTDNRGARYSQALWVTVTPASPVANRPPVAVATATPSSGRAPLPVTFSAAGSADPDGSVVSHTWTFGDGATGAGALVGHTYLTPGTYVATLTVTDNRGATSRATTSVVVESGGNRPPLAVITGAPLSGRAPLVVNFSGANSSDPDGPLTSYRWTFGDGAEASGVTASHTYPTAGTYVVTLTVTDALGATHSASVTVSVSSALPSAKNRAPIPVMTVTPALGAAPLVVVFDSAGSADIDGHIATYEWSFGNGASAAGPVASYRYTTPGTYLATLSVTDDRGLRNVAAAWVTVTR
ncbi:MAG: PKD domain-containing protein, partial [Vicinamibacterales bacterium]